VDQFEFGEMHEVNTPMKGSKIIGRASSAVAPCQSRPQLRPRRTRAGRTEREDEKR